MALGTPYSLKVTIIAAVVGMVGVMAAVMGFSAERKRITADQLIWVDSENRCILPHNRTVSLSIMAAFLLLLGQISITVAGGCPCCNPRINKYTSPAPLAIKSLILSWCTGQSLREPHPFFRATMIQTNDVENSWPSFGRASCVTAVIFFFYGAGVSNNHHARANPRPLPAATSASCGYAINAGVFAGGALITLLATASGIAYYLAVARIDAELLNHPKPQISIEVGRPVAATLHTT